MVACAVLGLCWENEDKYKRAIVELQKAIEASGRQSASYLDYLGRAYAASGNRVQGEKILDELDQMSKSGRVTPAYRAATLLVLGEKGKAIDALEESFGTGDGTLVWLKVEPRLLTLSSEP